jgi:hypothetical protein
VAESLQDILPFFEQVNGLFLMMGRGLERLSEVPAGCVLAIGGLERCILKSATLASTPACRPLAPMLFQVSPVRLPQPLTPPYPMLTDPKQGNLTSGRIHALSAVRICAKWQMPCELHAVSLRH